MSTEMAPTAVATESAVPTSAIVPQGMRKNGTYALALMHFGVDSNIHLLIICLGKQWHPVKKAFRPKAGNTPYEKRKANDEAMAATKAKEKEMKEEKEVKRKVSTNQIQLLS